MPQTDTVLLAYADFDVPTSFIKVWSDELVAEAQQAGLNVGVLSGDDSTYLNFANALGNTDPLLLYAGGHGEKKIFTLQNQEHALWVPSVEWGHDDSNINLVQGRIVYLLSCLTGQELGPAIAAQDNTEYLGYTEDFIFNGFEPGDQYSQAFGECSNVIMRTLMNGGTIQDAYNEGIRMFNLWIDIWEQSTDAGASFILSSLIHDRDALIALPGMPIPPPIAPVERKTIFPEMTIAGYGMILSASLL